MNTYILLLNPLTDFYELHICHFYYMYIILLDLILSNFKSLFYLRT